MSDFLRQFFTWWHEQTLSLRLWTWRHGVLVGEDEEGNRYYRHRRDSKRWVVYRGLVEASKTPPAWHAWLHHMTAKPPQTSALRHPWQKPHLPNMTGTDQAWRPPGSLRAEAVRPPAAGDYERWTPPQASKKKG